MRLFAGMAQDYAVTGWQGDTTGAPQGDGMIYAVIIACILENPVLALVNNYAVTLNASAVAGVQLAVTLAAVVVIAIRRPPLSRTFVAACCLFLFCALLKFIVMGSFNARFLYDSAMLPLFLVLGASARRFSPQFLAVIVLVLAVTAIVELVFPDLYAEVLNPRKYFYFTRDWVAAVTAPDASIATSSDIYLGSNRYTGSFFGASHRAGSLLLEPLSLGYMGIIGAIFFVHTPNLTIRHKAILIAACVLLAVLSDTRVAVFLIFAAVLLRNVAAKVQTAWLVAVPYMLVLTVVVLSVVLHALPGDLGLRLAVTADPLLQATPLTVFFGGVDDSKVADSGLVYLIANAGLIGFCVYPLLASGVLSGEGRPSPVAVSIMFYLMVTLIFGYAPMSIKTAAVLGYGVATLSRLSRKEGLPLPSAGASPSPGEA
jgi:putative polymerase